MFSTNAGSQADDAITDEVSEAVEVLEASEVPEVLDEAADTADVEGGEDGEDGEEPFWGMQSEGMQSQDSATLTGVALGSGARRLARVCLAVALGLGVVFWAVLIVLYTHRVFFQGASPNPDMPHLADDRPWSAYYLIGSLWAIGIGAWGLATRGGFARLTWCFACLVTAFFWPLGLAASVAALAIRRPSAAMSRRLLLAGAAVALLVGGSVWRFTAPAANPKQATVSSDADLVGKWSSHSGMSVDLHADGTYAASALSGGGLGNGDGVPASSGRWDSEAGDGSGDSGVRLQIDGDLANSVLFDVYRAGPDLVLCATSDPGEPCQVALRRG